MNKAQERKLKWAIRIYLALHGWSRTAYQLKKENRAKEILERFANEKD